MAYPQFTGAGFRSVNLPFDLIDKLVTVAEIMASHKAMSDDDVIKPMYLEVAQTLNGQIEQEMLTLGLTKLFEVRERLELPIARIINARKLAFASLQNAVDAGL